jgi:undecaprenyl phosphate N,N'-diacetylbacillosamine 1-phosphate transferase
MYRKFGKRIFDILVSAFLLLCLLPVLFAAAALVRLSSPGPVLFYQERLGRHGKTIKIAKIRTMTHRVRSVHIEIFGKTDGVTRVGYWLRRFKIDELPQLVSVLTGEMSLVGPRPALPAQINEYDAESRKRLQVAPGLTGLAQVSGNIYLSWQQRWAYDVRYVETLSFHVDMCILMKTIIVILLGEQNFRRLPSS